MSNAVATDLQKPGFYLLNDAGGRFVVDPDTGVVMLSDEGILDTERGMVHCAQLRVIEPSGYTYTLDLELRLTGRVPQMAGSEDLLAGFGIECEALTLTEIAGAYDEYDDEDGYDAEPVRIVSWAGFTATKGYIKPMLGSEHAPFGTLIELWIPGAGAGFASLTMMDDVPPPQSRTAIWSL
ncbi:MAG: hypothetical protein QM759_12580 [Terricaulis sp.]